MKDDFTIGDFKTPLIPPKANAPAPQGSPAQERLEGAEQQLEGKAKAAEKELAPLQAYEERLKDLGVTREEAANIIDSVLLKGAYAEDIKLTASVKMRLRTRTAKDIRRIQEYLEVAKPLYDNHYQEILNRMCLAASLERFGADTMAFVGKGAKAEDYEKAFQDRLAYIEALPDPTLRLLFSKLYRFDTKIRVVLEEGAIENV